MDEAPIRREDFQALDQLALVYAMVDRIQRARRVEQVYRQSVDGLREVVGVELCAVLTQSGEDTTVQAWSGARRGMDQPLAERRPWAPDRRDRHPVVVPPEELDESTEPVVAGLRDRGIRTLMWVPLLHRGRVMAELVLGRIAPAPFTEAETRLVEVIAGHVAFSIWRARSDEDRAELLRRFEAERSVLESVVNQMPAGVLLADVPSGRIITCNPQITGIWGKTLRHTGQVSDYALWGGLDDGGHPLEPEAWPLARAVLHGASIRGEEIEIERADGSRRVVRMSASPVVDSRGRQLAAVATVHDVTRDRQRERRQRYLEAATETLNASIELGATLDAVVGAVSGPFADWAVLYRPDSDGHRAVAAAHRDSDRREPLRVFTDRDAHAVEDHPAARVLRARSPLLITTGTGDPLSVVAVGDPVMRRAAARLGCESVLLLPLVCRDRELGVLAVVRESGRYTEEDVHLMMDLASRAALAVDNAELYERAREADRAKSNFLAVMSHEFRTPLSAILGYADILTARVHGELTPKQYAHLQRVKASVRHLSHLVDEILSFASMEAGRERVTRAKTDLTALVSSAVAIMEPIAEAAGLSLRVAVPDVPMVVRTDASKVRQIVINLVSNALKYTPEGSVSAELGRAGDTAYFRVTDTGPGIAPEHMERVFEPFWQVDQHEQQITGTGLGLAVARRLARLLGGDVELESTLGAGSRFTFTLPTGSGVATDQSP